MSIRWKILVVGLVAYSVFTTTLLLRLVDRVFALATNTSGASLAGTEASSTLQAIHIGAYVLAGFAGLVVLAELIGHFIADDRDAERS